MMDNEFEPMTPEQRESLAKWSTPAILNRFSPETIKRRWNEDLINFAVTPTDMDFMADSAKAISGMSIPIVHKLVPISESNPVITIGGYYDVSGIRPASCYQNVWEVMERIPAAKCQFGYSLFQYGGLMLAEHHAVVAYDGGLYDVTPCGHEINYFMPMDVRPKLDLTHGLLHLPASISKWRKNPKLTYCHDLMRNTTPYVHRRLSEQETTPGISLLGCDLI